MLGRSLVSPVLEEAWIEVEPGLEPLDVEVEGEGDAEVAVVDLEDVRDVQLHLDQVGLAAERDVHARVVSEEKKNKICSVSIINFLRSKVRIVTERMVKPTDIEPKSWFLNHICDSKQS